MFKRYGLLIIAALVLVNCQGKAQNAITDTITITNFNAYEKDHKQVVEWNTAAGINSYCWEVQCSYDGKTFATIALVLGDDPQQPGHFGYSGKIKQGTGPERYYRLCHNSAAGARQWSKIIRPAK